MYYSGTFVLIDFIILESRNYGNGYCGMRFGKVKKLSVPDPTNHTSDSNGCRWAL
jgi:hypothetical protein